MPPFLMSVLSATDLWMFIASNGGLTAGRTDASGALFPYETVDRLYERPGRGGAYTALRITGRDRKVLWRPFLFDPADEATSVRLGKSALGDTVTFEAEHAALALRVRQSWSPSERFGWVRRVELENVGSEPLLVDVLDGLLDVLPAGVELTTQQRASNLVDAYRHTDVEPEQFLAWYSLSSLIVDRAEPAEALRANVVWGFGLEGATLTVDPASVQAFLRDGPIEPTAGLRGRKPGFLGSLALRLEPGATRQWGQVGDVGLDGVQATALRGELRDVGARFERLEADLERSRRELETLTAALDGPQRGASSAPTLNHLANASFNGFRGGVLVDEGRIPKHDLIDFIASRHRIVGQRHQRWLEALPDRLAVADVRERAQSTADPDLQRLVLEYLPLAFGRRHGDPSRPWNRFSIRTRAADGSRSLNYEGNWRDIFQNWEALALSYPDYLPSMVAKFVNAMTVDGYNPYRISRAGIDWEVPDPDDPWSNIGYWGDHQIIYLLRLLEKLERFDPDRLASMLRARCFSFAAVPYRLASYDEMLADPRSTIRFDEEAQDSVQARVEDVGADGRLVWAQGSVLHATLSEKLLISLLAKLGNLVLDGGIWMNTQRPEWNDANNALAGYGLSVVTMAHTLRFVRFLRRHLGRSDVMLHAQVADWLQKTRFALEQHRVLLGAAPSSSARREALDALGGLYSEYRVSVYRAFDTEVTTVTASNVEDLLELAEAYSSSGLELNRREDGLFHSYNVLRLGPNTAEVERLPLMLEGQVAAIDSGSLSADEVGDVIDALFESDLYAEDRNSFLLYPDRELPPFIERNRIQPDAADAIGLLRELRAVGREDLVTRDEDGEDRFTGAPANVSAVRERLGRLAKEPEWQERVQRDQAEVLALYEETFRHAEFTGRSQGMYGFEGLGCIYWHMVAKLLVAIFESYVQAGSEAEAARERLAEAYHRVRRGLGFNKSPEAYGAFPTDPYSHTPSYAGAQQPGMTGQVKEQIITRFGELGLRVRGGRVSFEPSLLDPREVLAQAVEWTFRDPSGSLRTVSLPAGSLAYTWTGVPVVMSWGHASSSVVVHREGAAPAAIEGVELDAEMSRELFSRSGLIQRIDVRVATPGE